MSQRVLFVDDDPFILQSLRRICMVACSHWEVAFASSGEEALALLEQRMFDVVVTDMRMPGMDGTALLKQVRVSHPEVLRFVLSGQAENESLLRAFGPAHQYLSKPCDILQLKHAVDRALAIKDCLANEQLQSIVAKIDRLPSLSDNLRRLHQLLENPEASLDEISSIVGSDVSMTAKVLQLINSPCFGLSRPVVTAHHAIALLGYSRVRPLVLSAGIFAECDRSVSFPQMDHFMRHHAGVALRAQSISAYLCEDLLAAEYAYLAGMLHDVGKLVLMQHDPQRYRQTEILAVEENLPSWQAETRLFGTSHAEIGGYLLGLWGFPTPVVEAVIRHHRPTQSTTQDSLRCCLTAVHVADGIQHIHDHDLSHLDPSAMWDREFLDAMCLTDRLEAWMEFVPTANGIHHQ